MFELDLLKNKLKKIFQFSRFSYCDNWISVIRRQQLLQRTSPELLAGFLTNLAGIILINCSNGFGAMPI